MVESGTHNTALTLSREHNASTSSGYAMLLVMLLALTVGGGALTLIPSAPAIALIYRAAVPPTPAAEYFCDMIRRAAVPMLKRYPPAAK